MQGIVEWLIDIEELAGAFYREVSRAFKGDREISDFFHLLAAGEALHLRVMRNALKCLPALPDGMASITVDDATRERIEQMFTSNDELLASGELDREGLLGCLVTAEFSEWNDIFLYAVGVLKEGNREFGRAAATIQQHVRQIERFLEKLPGGERHLHVVKCLPPVWHERILIVEDREPIRELLKAVLKHEGVIEAVSDGKEAFSKLKDSYFDVIVSDVEMPGMDGIEFFKRAAEADPGIGSRFLFMTACPDEYLSFFGEHKLRCLLKPTPIKEIKRHVDEILHKKKKT